MTRLALIVAVACACGGTKPPPPAPVAKPAEPALDPACPPVKTFTLADGKLRCRELPLVVDFPANSAMEREDSNNVTFIRATLDRGALAVLVEPRPDAAGDDVDGLRKRLEALVKGIAEDAVIVDAPAPAQPGTTASAALSFTTPDGGAGLVYGYLAHGWFVAAIAGGRLQETITRPDKPAGKAFLASVKLRAPSTTWDRRAVFEGVALELPVAAWEIPVEPSGSEKATKLYAAVGERTWIGARDLEPSPTCEPFANVTDADVPTLVKKMFGNEDLEVTGRLAKLGKYAMYAEVATPAGTLVMYLACMDPQVLLVSVVGKRSPEELRTMLDRVIAPLRR